jgi:hypothetical protein
MKSGWFDIKSSRSVDLDHARPTSITVHGCRHLPSSGRGLRKPVLCGPTGSRLLPQRALRPQESRSMLSGQFQDHRDAGSGEGANSCGWASRIGGPAGLDCSCCFGDRRFPVTSWPFAHPIPTGISRQFLASPPSLILPSRHALCRQTLL